MAIPTSSILQRFNQLYGAGTRAADPSALDQIIEEMGKLLQMHSTSAPTPNCTVPPDQEDMQAKLNAIIQRSKQFHQKIESAPSIPQPSAVKMAPKVPEAKDYVVGFCNKKSNCWVISLLHMILRVPNLKQMFLTVAYSYGNEQSGQAMIDALTAYEKAFQNKLPVDAEVSQRVRVAFHALFGSGIKFSEKEEAQEDVCEALHALKDRYEEMAGGTFTEIYTPQQTKRFYEPVGEAREARANKDYSRLASDLCSSPAPVSDFQISLDLKNTKNYLLRDLLSRYFNNTQVDGSDPSIYLNPEGKEQTYKLIRETKQFLRTPEEFILTLKLFERHPDGRLLKNTNPAILFRTLVLEPGAIATVSTPIAYDLDAFVVHNGGFGGGHYIAYKKMDNRWLECDDAAVRFVSLDEIDQILQRRREPYFTSYLHHYTRVPDAKQADALREAEKNVLSPHVIAIQTHMQEKQKRQEILGFLEKISSLLRAGRDCSTEMLLLCDYVPEIGAQCIGVAPTAIDKVIAVENAKLAIASHRINLAQIALFQEVMNTPQLSNEALLKAFTTLSQEEVQWPLHGLLYEAHKKKFGEAHVNHPFFQNQYGRKILEANLLSSLCEPAASSQRSILDERIFQIEQAIKHLMPAASTKKTDV